MEFRSIKNSDLSVSALSLGTMTFGSPVSFDEAIGLIHYALDQGVNLIDTANMYEGYRRVAGSAGGVAEEIVGRAVCACREQVIIATKVGMKVGTKPEDSGTSAAAIQLQLEKSLRRLGTDYIDLYYLHCYDANVSAEEILLALDKERRAGKLRYYGVSNYTAEQLGALLREAERLRLPRPVICQPALSLLKPEALSDLLPLCEREGIAVSPYQILQGGLLTGKYRRDGALPAGSRMDEKPDWMWKFTDEIYDQLDAIRAAAEKQAVTMTQYAIRWALRQAAVVTTVIGVKNKSQIDEAVQALE